MRKLLKGFCQICYDGLFACPSVLEGSKMSECYRMCKTVWCSFLQVLDLDEQFLIQGLAPTQYRQTFFSWTNAVVLTGECEIILFARIAFMIIVKTIERWCGFIIWTFLKLPECNNTLAIFLSECKSLSVKFSPEVSHFYPDSRLLFGCYWIISEIYEIDSRLAKTSFPSPTTFWCP